MSAEAVKQLRESGRVDDAAFDEIFPAWARALSRVHFTPVTAAVRAAAWLAAQVPRARILDVGAGAGKFCLLGALTTRGVFTGVERRPRLAALATELARENDIERCTFIEGDALSVDWRDFDGIYCYNPFAELLADAHYIDETLPRTSAEFHRQVDGVEARLASLRSGTRLVTYHGFGGVMPAGWHVVTSLRLDGGSLTSWMKTLD